jgi:plasmid replication initiation protein
MADSRQLDLFYAFVGDVPLRDDREAMILPTLSLSKAKRIAPIEWSSADGSTWVKVYPHAEYGIATIWDYDVILWAVSQLNEAVEHGIEPRPTIRFMPHELLRSIGRATGGLQYQQLQAALTRLRGTTIHTNVRGSGRKKVAVFGWLEDWTDVIDEATGLSRGMSLTVPRWIFDGVVRERAVLSIPPAYFDLTGGIERWLFRLGRKMVGHQADGWRFSVSHLWERSGSSRQLKLFKHDLKKVVEADRLPGYRLIWEEEGRAEPDLWISPRPDL